MESLHYLLMRCHAGMSRRVMARAAGLGLSAGEGVVLAICQVLPVRFGTMKVIFDVTLVCLSVTIGLVFLGRVEGVREGTVAAALLVGLLTRRFQKPAAALRRRCLA